jgi:hypothetical protein
MKPNIDMFTGNIEYYGEWFRSPHSANDIFPTLKTVKTVERV